MLGASLFVKFAVEYIFEQLQCTLLLSLSDLAVAAKVVVVMLYAAIMIQGIVMIKHKGNFADGCNERMNEAEVVVVVVFILWAIGQLERTKRISLDSAAALRRCSRGQMKNGSPVHNDCWEMINFTAQASIDCLNQELGEYSCRGRCQRRNVQNY